MNDVHLSIDCALGRHDRCCDETCTCHCHVKAIDRDDVPQEDQFL